MVGQKGRMRLGFTIPTLLAAGAAPFSAQGEVAENENSATESMIERIKGIVLGIEEQQIYTLAQHSSHASHGSHGSHGSHASHSSFNGVNLVVPLEQGAELSTARNESSTPRSTILPSSPAITSTKKLKRLPGNTQKFKDTVFQVQIALASRGFDVGDINGEMHARTIASVHEYQADHSNLMPTGKLTTETLSSLNILVL